MVAGRVVGAKNGVDLSMFSCVYDVFSLFSYVYEVLMVAGRVIGAKNGVDLSLFHFLMTFSLCFRVFMLF